MNTTMTRRLDHTTHDRLSSLASVTDRSKAYLTLQALKSFLDNNEWQVQSIKEAVSAADAAGSDQWLDNEVVMAWLATWGTDDESQPPL